MRAESSRSRRIVILTNGSRGDVQPLVALGRGLMRAGHEVLLAADAQFRPFVTDHGVPYAEMGGDVRALLESETAMRLRDEGKQLRWMLHAIRESGAYLARGYRDAWAICEAFRPDLVIFTIATPVGYSIAERLGVPGIYAGMQPITPTGAFPTIWAGQRSLGSWLNRATHLFFDQLFWQTHRPYLNPFRSRQLGLPVLPFLGPARRQAREGMPVLYAYSSAVVPPPADWPASVSVTGYWFLDHAADWAPPAALERFLAAGPPPVYVGFGSMANADAIEQTRMFLAALQLAGQRGILITGWGGLAAEIALPPDVYALPEIPHSYLLPRVAAAVHHGGGGTTAAALRAGVPAITIPYIGDHFFWGRRIADLGVGPAPLTIRQLSADALAAAIRSAVSDPALRRRAAELGATIRAEDGVGAAIERINGALGVPARERHV